MSLVFQVFTKICNFEKNFLDFYSVISTLFNVYYIEMHNKKNINSISDPELLSYSLKVFAKAPIFIGLSVFSAVFPVTRVFPVNLGTGSGIWWGPQGFWGSGENGYLFSGSWGALVIISRDLGSKLIVLGDLGSTARK